MKGKENTSDDEKDGEKRPVIQRRSSGLKITRQKPSERKPKRPSSDEKPTYSAPEKPFRASPGKRIEGDNEFKRPTSGGSRENKDRSGSEGRFKKPSDKSPRSFGKSKRESGEKPSFGNKREGSKRPEFGNKKPGARGRIESGKRFSKPGDSSFRKDKPGYKEPYEPSDKAKRSIEQQPTGPVREGVRLNKYIANSGVCSRRDADELIAQGLITINGKVVTEMGVKVLPGDVVRYGDDPLSFQKFVYLLMNKPKDFITTAEDPEGRKTVMDIIGDNVAERIYPVGRLDRATTGVLMLTNDGDLAKKLTHPSFGIKKLYYVSTTQAVSKIDLDRLMAGIELEDGFVKPDQVSYVGESTNRKEIGIEIHSGKNRVIRRLFEALGYKVAKLDRVMFAGLTKKNLARGQWRTLTDREVAFLKMM